MSFFVNLYNFLILYGLCKHRSVNLPKTQLEWINFEKSVPVKIENFVITPFEIKYAILRDKMPDPNIPNPYLDGVTVYEKFESSDQRYYFTYRKNEPLINFALWIPTRSSPSLRIYNPGKIFEEMKENCSKYLDKTFQISSDKSTLILPSIFDWYKNDFIKGGDKSKYIFFLENNLKANSLKKLKMFEKSAIKQYQYVKYDWSFEFDYIETKDKIGRAHV